MLNTSGDAYDSSNAFVDGCDNEYSVTGTEDPAPGGTIHTTLVFVRRCCTMGHDDEPTVTATGHCGDGIFVPVMRRRDPPAVSGSGVSPSERSLPLVSVRSDRVGGTIPSSPELVAF